MSYPRQQGGPVAVPVSDKPPDPPPLSGPFAGQPLSTTPQDTAMSNQMAKFKKIEKCLNMLPVMHQCWAWTCFILNTIIPGFGTILAAFVVLTCCAKHDGFGDRCRVSCIQFWFGIGMLVTCPLFIGFFWAAWWGWLYVVISVLKYHGNFDPKATEDQDIAVVVTKT